MKIHHAKRLLKLASFIETLPPEKFAMDRLVTSYVNNCGTCCCMLGWTPTVFPKLVRWEKICEGVVVVNHRGELFWRWTETAMRLFGLSCAQDVDYLFNTTTNCPNDCRVVLTNETTPAEAAAHLRAYVKTKFPNL